jgi:hypothetical protein
VKNVVVKILASIVITVSSFGILFSIINFLEIRKSEEVNFTTDTQLKKLKKDLSYSKNIIDKINEETNKGTLSTDDFNSLKTDVNICLGKLQKLDVLNYKGIIKITDKDKYALIENTNDNFCNNFLNSFKIMEANDSSLKGISDMMTSYIYLWMIGKEPINLRLVENYYYSLKDYYSSNINISYSYETDLIIAYNDSQVTTLGFISNWLLNKMGSDINE